MTLFYGKVVSQSNSQRITLIQGYNSQAQGHWATSSNSLPTGFSFDSSYLLPNSSVPLTLSVFQCQSAGSSNNFISLDPDCESQQVLAKIGHIYYNQTNDFTTPLYRCFNPSNSDKFISRNSCSSYQTDYFLGFSRKSKT